MASQNSIESVDRLRALYRGLARRLGRQLELPRLPGADAGHAAHS